MFSAPNLSEKSEQKLDTVPEITTIDENPFKLVTTSIDNVLRDNSLYRLIEDLLPQNLPVLEAKQQKESALLDNHRVEKLSKHKAWLIHFDEAPETNLFSKEIFTFEGSHLRIDAHFANDNTFKAKQGFTTCHFYRTASA